MQEAFTVRITVDGAGEADGEMVVRNVLLNDTITIKDQGTLVMNIEILPNSNLEPEKKHRFGLSLPNWARLLHG